MANILIYGGAALVVCGIWIISIGLALMRRAQLALEAIGKTAAPRFVARSREVAPGWGVWDAEEERFLSDEELRTISLERIQHERIERQEK